MKNTKPINSMVAGYDKVKLPASIDLKGKEVYLAQVPKDFDPKKAEFKSSTEVLCQGATYFVNSSASLANCQILTAGKNGKLTPCSTKLTGLLAFTKKVPLPKINYEVVHVEKPRILQKTNLRMRNFPTGYGPEDYRVNTLPNKHKQDATESPARKKHKKEDEEKMPKKEKKDKKDKV